MRFLVPHFLTAILSSTAHSAPWQDAIIHGDPAASGSFVARSAVLIVPAGPDGNHCSGVLVAPDLVATAAHCVVKGETNSVLAPTQLAVDFTLYYDGSTAIEREPIRRISGIRKHPGYDNDEADSAGNPHDIALLRLADPAPAPYVPATLLPSAPGLTLGATVLVGGYGDTCDVCDDEDFRLRTFEFRVAGFRRPTSLVALAGKSKGGVANGDSGGPAFAMIGGKAYLWGVLSSARHTGSPAFYENLLEYRALLEQWARELGSSLRWP